MMHICKYSHIYREIINVPFSYTRIKIEKMKKVLYCGSASSLSEA